VAALVGLVGCGASSKRFYDKVFPCDSSMPASVDQCGTTRDGKPMVCYPGSTLGGSDFCAPACDPAADAPAGSRCLTPGALVQFCAPKAGETDPSQGCPEALACYRTDLLADEGVCLMMTVCANDSDCYGTMRNLCAATLVREISPALSGVDHLQCVQPTCKSSTTGCTPGESCLAKYYYLDSNIVDMCVPNCDSHGSCPPNYACARTATSPGAPAICIPGLPGQRCVLDQDCSFGSCVDLGVEFKECVSPLPCSSDASCDYLSSLATYLCVDIPAVGRRCVSTTPFQGVACDDSSECPDGQECFFYSPFVNVQQTGECRVPCGADLSCPARGGIPHLCLDEGRGGCYPGGLGLPCTDSSQCFPGLSCLPAPPDPRSKITSATICTVACEADVDCDMKVVGDDPTFCGDGVCRLTGAEGEPCDRDHQCAGMHCFIDAGVGTCGP
jgi:hypothetical protein